MPTDSMPLVSVIVPTFNRAYCLARTVDSVLGQTYRNVEVLVIDDGSTDGTKQLVAARYGSDPRVKYLHQENSGVSSARNHGFARARGDFIALLDSDDVWRPWKLDLQIACMSVRPEIGMIWTDMEAVNPNGKVTNPTYLRTMYHAWRHFTPETLFGPGTRLADLAGQFQHLSPYIAAGQIEPDVRFYTGSIYSPMIMGSLVHTSTVIIRRNRLEQVKAFDVALAPAGEDYDFHLRTCREGPVGFLDLATIRYQTEMPDRLTHPAYHLDTALNTLKTIVPLIKSREGISLPTAMLRRRLAEVHDWVAYIMFDQGNLRGCRRHMRASLLQWPWSSRSWMFFLVSHFPAATVASLRRIRRGWTRTNPVTEAL